MHNNVVLRAAQAVTPVYLTNWREKKERRKKKKNRGFLGDGCLNGGGRSKGINKQKRDGD